MRKRVESENHIYSTFSYIVRTDGQTDRRTDGQTDGRTWRWLGCFNSHSFLMEKGETERERVPGERERQKERREIGRSLIHIILPYLGTLPYIYRGTLSCRPSTTVLSISKRWRRDPCVLNSPSRRCRCQLLLLVLQRYLSKVSCRSYVGRYLLTLPYLGNLATPCQRDYPMSR